MVIENDGPTNDDLGRVVGQAVAQTLQHLRVNRPATTSTTASTGTSTETSVPASTQTTTKAKNEKKSQNNGSTAKMERASNTMNQKRPSSSRTDTAVCIKRRKKDLEELFQPDQLKMPIIEYLIGGAKHVARNNGRMEDSDTFIRELGKKLNEVILQDFIK